jgi:hypothetical protein
MPGSTAVARPWVLVEYAAATPASPPTVTDIRQDLADFDSRFALPAARIQVLTAMAGSVSPWLAGAEEAGDTEMVHAVAPDATIRELMVDVAHVTTPAEFAAMVNASHLAALVRAGATFINGKLVERPSEEAQLEAA